MQKDAERDTQRLHWSVAKLAAEGPYKNEGGVPAEKFVCMWWDRVYVPLSSPHARRVELNLVSSTLFWAVEGPVERQWSYYTAQLEQPKACSYMKEESVAQHTQDDFQQLLQERVTYGYRLQWIYGRDEPLIHI